MRTARSPARGHVTTDGTFRCDACCSRRTKAARHPSGFCVDCQAKHRRYWRRRYTQAEIDALAACLWPDLAAGLPAAA